MANNAVQSCRDDLLSLLYFYRSRQERILPEHLSKSHIRHNQHRQPVKLVSGDNVNQIFADHAAHQSHAGAEDAQQRVKEDRAFIAGTVGENPLPVVYNLVKGALLPAADEGIQCL